MPHTTDSSGTPRQVANSGEVGAGGESVLVEERVTRELLRAMRQARSGDHAAAAVIYESLLDVAPRHPDLLHHYAVTLWKRGWTERAIRCMHRSLETCEAQDAVHLNLGRIHFRSKKFDRALEHAGRACELNPANAEAAKLRGRCLVLEGRFAEAIESLLAAIDRRPQDQELLVWLADAFDKNGDVEQAIEWYRYALERTPHDLAARTACALLLRRFNRAEEALRELQTGVRLLPSEQGLRQSLATQYEEMGRFEDALHTYREVLRAEPNHALALGGVLRVDRSGERGEEAERAARLAQAVDTAQFDRIYLSYALGRHFDRQGEYATAFRYFSIANELKASALAYDSRALERFVTTSIEAFDTPYLQGLELEPWTGKQLVFIVGLPRSGTTLVEQILSSHSRVFGGGEIGYLTGLLGAGTDGPSPMLLAARESKLTASELHEVRAKYAAIIDQFGTACTTVTDKMPFNFLHLGLIMLMFPGSRIVHCRRNILDNGLSCYMENLTSDFTFATSFDRMAHYHGQHERLMAHWHSLFGERILTVRYEELVEDVRAHAQRLVSFAGLPWEPACLDFFNSTRAVMTPSNWQVRQPIYTSSRGRWRRYASFLRPFAEALTKRGIPHELPQDTPVTPGLAGPQS